MTPEQLTTTKQIAEAIDVLQDHNVLGDEQSDALFLEHLESVGSSYEDYWQSIDPSFIQIMQVVRRR